MAWLFASVIMVCATSLYALRMSYELENTRMVEHNTQLLTDELEKKIQMIDELKPKMEMLLLKNGFGR